MTTRLLVSALICSAFVACADGSDAPPACGDGHVDPGEQCDDGNTSEGDSCTPTCMTETCGDGVVDVATENCDDGNRMSNDGCSSRCQDECGNGQLDGSEACDDGNKQAGDGCSMYCVVETDFTCTGEPSDCTRPIGSCTDPFVVNMMNNAGTLAGIGMGDSSMATMDQMPEYDCDGFPSGAANDHIWKFTIGEPRDVVINVTSATFYPLIRLLALSCDQSSEVSEGLGEDGCSEGFGSNTMLSYSGLPAGTYFVVIDSYDTFDAGAYSFTVTASTTACGNGTVDPIEDCDDGNTATNDGCNASCNVELGYACTGTMPSVCTSACGNNHIDTGEECDDNNTTPGDRCSATCTLEYDMMETEPGNNTVAEVVTPSTHFIRGTLTSGDVDLYTITLTAPATVELETYTLIDPDHTYAGVGNAFMIDCTSDGDTEIRVFDSTGNPTDDQTAIITDDEDGDGSCSYVGPNDDDGNPMEGMLPAGTYTIKVNHYSSFGTTERYILELRTSSTMSSPLPPVPGDLVINEFMAADNMSDTNCDSSVTGTADEFVEIVNVSSKILDITGVSIWDANLTTAPRHTFAAGPTGSMILDPGKSVVVWSAGTPACGGVTNWFLASSTQLGLNDAGDTITLKDAAQVQLTQVVYPAATMNVSSNLAPDVVGTMHALHNTLTGALGNFSPGMRANGSAF